MVNLSPIMLIKLLLFFLTLLMIVSSRSKGEEGGWLAQVRDKAQRCGVQKCKDTMVYK